MASEGPNSGATFADDSGIGTSAWTSPGNAAASDNSRASAGIGATASFPQISTIKLVKGGTIQGNNNGNSTPITNTDTYYSFGSSSDMWGLTLTPTDINASDFGVAVSMNVPTESTTHYLKATNFSFSIPSDGTIVGVVAEVEASGGTAGPIRLALIDHIRITVYYTLPSTFNALFLAGD